jgi:phosphoribosyl 1,2-cyclic phosphodiesterase
MRITPLASGSAGNALLVEAAGTRLLIDAGLHVDELERRLELVGLRPERIDALFLTHRHKDHVRGATDFARRHKTKVRTTRRTARALGTEVLRRLVRIDFERPFEVGGLRLRAVPLRHDAPDTAGLLVEAEGRRFGYATDLGSFDAATVDAFTGCNGLFLEFNHCRDLLLAGEDPPHLKRRILGPLGHLSNQDAELLLARLAHPRLAAVWLGHLSQRNNRPERAIAAARRALAGCPAAAIHVAEQDRPLAPVALGAAALNPIETPGEGRAP